MADLSDNDPPDVLSYASVPVGEKPIDPAKLALPLAVLLTSAVLGSVVGAWLMVVNYALSPVYFIWDLDWSPIDLFEHCLLAGAFVGALTAGFGGLILGSIVGSPSYTKVKFRDLHSYLALTLAMGLVAWMLGGIWGMTCSARNADAFFSEGYRPSMHHRYDLMRFSWVYGSSHGALIGGLIGACGGPVLFCRRRKGRAAASKQPAVLE